MASSPKLIMKGHKELIRKLKRLGNPRLLKKVVRQGVNAGGTVLVKGVRKEWPTDSGLSKRSVNKKVVSTKAGYIAVVGIDKEAQGELHGRKHVPANIDHLIEFGWQMEDGTNVPARAPLRKGHAATKEAAMSAFVNKAKTAIEREAAKR